ncbi:MAG: hypothetical protein RMK84_09455 [Oscillochloridaceae bacterium]|nr:hypothetical protein [Chloroflexaceae bacterium]MDW8390340.1 hypothetical protein [Oscillochloridaceae bacterium]
MTDAYDWHEEASESGLPGDDFTRIAGIGPVIKRQLYAAGIRTFQQLAAIAPEDIIRLAKDLPLLSVERIIRQDWTGQARRLAAERSRERAARYDLPAGDRGVRVEVVAISLDDVADDRRLPRPARRFQARLYLRLRGPRAFPVAAERLWFTTLLLAWSYATGAARVLSSGRARLSADRLVYSPALTGALTDDDRYHLAGIAFLADEAVVGHASGPYLFGPRPPAARRLAPPDVSARIQRIILDAPSGAPFLAADHPVEAAIRFRVEPAPARGATGFACLLAHEASTGRMLILGGEGRELQAGRRDQTITMTLRASGAARYHLISAVFVPEMSLLDVAAGPVIRVARQER